MRADGSPRASGFDAMTRSPAAWASMLVLLALALYWRAPFLGFAGDDALVLYHLKRLGGLARPSAFFTSLDFFTYYRPIGFLTFAADAAAWGWRPGGFHITNVALHAVNTLLVFALARRLMAPSAAALAAALFAAHTSNQEAVYWISARFDLLSTCGVLATVLLATRPQPAWTAVAMGTFALGLLSKEAALAAPIIVGAYEVFINRSRPRRVIVIMALMLAVVGAYSAARSVVGGLDPTGGASRLPKAAMLAGGVATLVVLARTGWERAAGAAARLKPLPVALVGLLVLAAAAVACLPPGAGTPIREKLSFAGFAGFYLISPVVAPASPPFFLNPATPVYWAGGLLVTALVGLAAFAARARLVRDATWLFIVVATAGALVPVSSLTEGSRYLYLGSVGVSLAGAKLAVDATGRRRRVVLAVMAGFLAVSAWQIQVKGADWAWATGMLSRGSALVNADLPACGAGDVVFLTAPIGVRGVYSHFYQQTFSQDGGCEPASYRAVARLVRTDERIDVWWETPRRLVVRAPDYAGNFVLSADLREFRVEQRSRRTARLETPLGLVTSRPDGRAQVVTLDLSPALDLGQMRFYYFSRGEVRRVPPNPGHAPEFQ
jgi:hypothetical protein